MQIVRLDRLFASCVSFILDFAKFLIDSICRCILFVMFPGTVLEVVIPENVTFLSILFFGLAEVPPMLSFLVHQPKRICLLLYLKGEI